MLAKRKIKTKSYTPGWLLITIETRKFLKILDDCLLSLLTEFFKPLLGHSPSLILRKKTRPRPKNLSFLYKNSFLELLTGKEFLFFFYLFFLSRPFTNHRITPHYHFHPLHRHLDISRAIAAKNSPLHIGSKFPSASCYTKVPNKRGPLLIFFEKKIRPKGVYSVNLSGEVPC